MNQMRHPSSLFRRSPGPRLYGKRVMLRPLVGSDFPEWHEVRTRNEGWLVPWEPKRPVSAPDPTRDRGAFESRCSARERERLADHAYPFGVFVDQCFAGEVNINNVTRGALQSGTIGYWIDQARAGRSYIAESVVVAARYAFEELDLHRLEVCIVPRNVNSRRVMDKLCLREEGVALRFLEINGTWEDHVRYAITLEEWAERRDELVATWISD
jgi:ribosomal-protein-alanine N-acetyltransferase